VEYHKSEQNTFCTEAALVPKQGSHEEDDGWIITFVHNEDTSICPKKVNFALWYIIIIRLLYLKYLSTFIGLYNWHQKVYQWASCQNHVAMLSPIWISWSFHANPVAKFDSIKCLHHHFLFSSLLGYKLYNLDDIQNFFLLIVVYDIHSALNIEFKV